MEILAVEKTLNIDLYGPEKAVNCAEDFDVKQYLQVSATDSLYPEAGSGAVCCFMTHVRLSHPTIIT